MTFGDLLREQMQAKKISASNLARAVWGTTTDYRGHTVARGRDRIGHYLSGASFPKKENLIKIATALNTPVKTLEAALPVPRLRGADAPNSITVTIGLMGVHCLSINKIDVTKKTADKIIALIREDDPYGLWPKAAS